MKRTTTPKESQGKASDKRQAGLCHNPHLCCAEVPDSMPVFPRWYHVLGPSGLCSCVLKKLDRKVQVRKAIVTSREHCTLQAVLAQKRGLQKPAGGNEQKKGSVKGKGLAIPVGKSLGGRGQAGGAGKRGRGGRGSVGGRGSFGGRAQPAEKKWNPASLKITIKNDKVGTLPGFFAEPYLLCTCHRAVPLAP